VEEEHDDDDAEAEDLRDNNAAAASVKSALAVAAADVSVGTTTGKRARQDDDVDAGDDANLDKAVAGVAAADGSMGDAAVQTPAAKKQKVVSTAADGGSEAASVPLAPVAAQADKQVA
jgi:hypothetical protein